MKTVYTIRMIPNDVQRAEAIAMFDNILMAKSVCEHLNKTATGGYAKEFFVCVEKANKIKEIFTR